MILTATPAYGADYRTKRQVQEAWAEGKDFQALPCGRYFNIRDLTHLRQEGVRWLAIRYKCLSHVHIIKIAT